MEAKQAQNKVKKLEKKAKKLGVIVSNPTKRRNRIVNMDMASGPDKSVAMVKWPDNKVVSVDFETTGPWRTWQKEVLRKMLESKMADPYPDYFEFQIDQYRWHKNNT